eukprot:TRINITY_DN18627_c0_g1_i1.p1 TRINITY_DN18627_c0_g1~~TRINITY_DN18627_c0_g1_i1.p1  ORF type:complete len:361 (-),score=63.83 TRINITY_DN18627_c0_g1_i1:46-1128(-)
MLRFGQTLIRSTQQRSGYIRRVNGIYPLKIKSPIVQQYSSYSNSLISERSPIPRATEKNILVHELNQILKLPKDIYDIFINRFNLFKRKQISGFGELDELDEIASLIEDLRQSLCVHQNIDQYDLEMALSSLSQYCLDIDLNFLKKSREDILAQMIKQEQAQVINTMPKFLDELPTTKHKNYKPQFYYEQTSSSKLVTTIKTIKETQLKPSHNISEDTTVTESEEEQQQPLQQISHPPASRMKNFLKQQFDIITSSLKQNNFRHDKASKKLGMTPRQFSSLLSTLSKCGFPLRNFSNAEDSGFLFINTHTALKISFDNAFKAQRSALLKLSTDTRGVILTEEEAETLKNRGFGKFKKAQN